MPSIERVKVGQGWPRAQSWNTMADICEGMNGLSAAGLADLLKQPYGAIIALFELTEDFQMPDATRTTGSASESDVPWSDNARYVIYQHAEWTYKIEAATDYKVTLYAPVCERNTSGIANGICPGVDGDRFWAIYNRQSSRWEIIVSPPLWYFGKLDAQLNANSSAIVSIWMWNGAAWADSGINKTVYAPPLLSSGSIASGKWVRVEYNTQAMRWYVISAEC